MNDTHTDINNKLKDRNTLNEFLDKVDRNMQQADRTRLWYGYTDQDRYIAAEGTYGLTPDIIDEERLHLKMELIAEEFAELVEAVYGEKSMEAVKRGFAKALVLDEKVRDIHGAADATGDLRVVLDGFDLETGIPTEAVAHEVLCSNMSKLDENMNPVVSDGITPALHDGKIKPAGKVGKSKFWFEPDLEAIFDGLTPDRTPVLEKQDNEK